MRALIAVAALLLGLAVVVPLGGGSPPAEPPGHLCPPETAAGPAAARAACPVLWRDSGDGGATRRWGKDEYGCVSDSRRPRVTSVSDAADLPGADARIPADPGAGDARMLTVFDGDSPAGTPDREERCELGVNYHAVPEDPRPSAPTVLYGEGDRVTTTFSIYLPANYPLGDRRWQTVMQMKQAIPSDLSTGGGSDGLSPALELNARGGEWRLYNNWEPIWSAPARRGRWTRFALQAHYTSTRVDDVPQGWLRVYVDLDGDGEFSGPAESQPAVRNIQTLKAEVTDPVGEASDADGIAAGESIPSHLRMGLYHDPTIPCPPPEGCSIGIDDVAVIGAPSAP